MVVSALGTHVRVAKYPSDAAEALAPALVSHLVAVEGIRDVGGDAGAAGDAAPGSGRAVAPAVVVSGDDLHAGDLLAGGQPLADAAAAPRLACAFVAHLVAVEDVGEVDGDAAAAEGPAPVVRGAGRLLVWRRPSPLALHERHSRAFGDKCSLEFVFEFRGPALVPLTIRVFCMALLLVLILPRGFLSAN